jgi:hypothetical protein
MSDDVKDEDRFVRVVIENAQRFRSQQRLEPAAV